MAWYPLNGNLKDYSGKSNDLSINNTVELTTNGKIGGNAPIFAGNAANGLYVNDFIQNTEKWQSNFSYACWVYINAETNNHQYLISNGRDCGDEGSGCNLQIRNDLTIGIDAKGQQHKSTGITISLKTWTHITLVCDKTTLYFYVNGELRTTLNNTGFSYKEAKNNALYIGKMSYNSSTNYFPLNGSIQDVRIYDHCLSDTEIKKISQGLILHYNMSNPDWDNNLLRGTAEWEYWLDKADVDINGSVLTMNSSVSYPKYEPVEVTVGKQYVVSVDTKADENFTATDGIIIFDYLDSSKNRVLYYWGAGNYTTKWERKNWIITVPSDNRIKYISLGVRARDGKKVYYKKLKLESGDTPHPWCDNSTFSYEPDKVYDTTGYGNNGISTNIKYTIDNKRGVTSAAFESDNQSVISFNNTLSKTWEISCGCWVYKNDWNTFSGDEAIVAFTSNKGIHFNIKNESRALGTKAAIFIYDEDIQTSRFLQCGTGTDYMHSLSDGWHHIFMTSSESQLKLYIDGKIVTATSKIETYNVNFNKTSYIGSNPDGRFFNGKIDDFRIYTTTLSDRDVLQLYRETQKIDNKGNLYCSELNEVERRVEYLESDGTQWIDTGIIPDHSTIRVNTIMSTNGDIYENSGGYSLFGMWDSFNFRIFKASNVPESGMLRVQLGGKSTNISGISLDNSKLDINFSHDSLYINNIEKNIDVGNNTQSAQPIYIFASKSTTSSIPEWLDYSCNIRCYQFKIWNNNILVRDFLPVISTEEGHIGEACLFDTVTNTYFYNQGTGKFTTNLDESTSNIDFTSKGIVNTDYIIEGKDKTKILNDGNIIEVNNLYEN